MVIVTSVNNKVLIQSIVESAAKKKKILVKGETDLFEQETKMKEDGIISVIIITGRHVVLS
jgi:hypothetical protein